MRGYRRRTVLRQVVGMHMVIIYHEGSLQDNIYLQSRPIPLNRTLDYGPKKAMEIRRHVCLYGCRCESVSVCGRAITIHWFHPIYASPAQDVGCWNWDSQVTGNSGNGEQKATV